MPKFDSLRIFALWMTVALLLALQRLCYADASTASLTIAVSDSSGAVIPQAQVALRNMETNQEQRSISGKTGNTAFPFLRPGHYSLTVSKGNFSDIAVDNIQLNVGDEKHLALILKVGATTQNVTVDGSGLVMNTTDGSVSTVVDRKFVVNVPLNGRSFQDLISMTPGVVTDSPQTVDQAANANGDFSVNGQRTESNNYLVDGVSGNISAGTGHGGLEPGSSGSLAGATALGTTQTLVSVDALQEFRVLSSTYSAEYGQRPGGQFSFVTRSGTNALHGAIFDYLRNNYFDANDWFDNRLGSPMPALRQNDFGGTVGGPVWFPGLYNGTNKSFFFLSYEGLRLTQPQAASVQYVPDTNLRHEGPVALQPILNAFPVQTGPEAFVPCTSGTTSLYPCPAGDPTDTPVPSGLALFSSAYSLPSTIDSTSLRLDHVFGPKFALFFRFGDTPSSTDSRVLSSLQQNRSNTLTYTVRATSQIASNITNEFGLGYAQANSSFTLSLDSFGGATPANLATLEGLDAYSNPQAYFEMVISGVGSTLIQTSTGENLGRQWNATDTASISFGHHQIRIGINYRRIKSVANQSDVTGLPLFDDANAVLGNTANLLILEKGSHSTPIFNETAVFIQDEWHTAPHLNFSLGVRWELDPPPTEEHGHDAYTILGSLSNPSSITLAPLGTPLWKTTYYNLAPRLGIAWQAHINSGWDTVVRGGGGVFFDTANEPAVNGFEELGYDASSLYFNVPLPVTTSQLSFAPSVSPPYTSQPIYAFPKHLQLPYTLQWNVSMQQGLGKAQAFTLSYIGANGRRLLQEQEFAIGALNPNFGTVYYFPGNITSSYNALQGTFQRSVTKGLQALTSYTWSHSFDLGSTYATLPLTRGASDFDVRNNLQAGLSWELPGIKSKQAAQTILNGWGLDARLLARTAYPITITGNQETDPATGNQYYTGANLISGVPVYLHGSSYPGGRIVNAAAFSLPMGAGIGDAPRNFVRGFGENQINLAARRTFQVGERASIQFRAETFNLLNHPNFGYVDPILTDATFGQATQTLNESLATVASQYQQGGPRSMQFALRLSF